MRKISDPWRLIMMMKVDVPWRLTPSIGSMVKSRTVPPELGVPPADKEIERSIFHLKGTQPRWMGRRPVGWDLKIGGLKLDIEEVIDVVAALYS